MKNRKFFTVIALGASSILALSACSGDRANEGDGISLRGGGDTQTSEVETDSSSDKRDSGEGDAKIDRDDNGDSDKSSGNQKTSTNISKDLLKAIKKAENETGATAHSAELEDNGKWEIELSTKSASFDVDVSRDGSKILSVDKDDFDDDEWKELTKSKVTISEAIESSGWVNIESIELSEDDGDLHWEIENTSDEEMDIHAVNGTILVDRDDD